MLALVVLAVLVLLVLAPVTRYGGYYPATWNAGYGWLPAVLVVLLLVWLVAGGGLLR